MKTAKKCAVIRWSKTMSGKTFMLMAGGTGGHIFPALAVAESLQKRGHHVIWLGSQDSMEERIVPQYGIRLETLAIKGIRGNGIKRKLMLPVTLYKTVRAAQQIIKKHRVECVIGFGGFVTFPGGLAAKISGVPIVIHEQNAVAGLSNRQLSRWAKRVLYAFPKAFQHEGGLVGNPVRADIAALPVNMGSVLFNNSDGKVTMLDISTLGILYILEKGDQSIKSVEDLKGKTIIAHGQGATPEYSLSYILSGHGLDINTDVTMDWKSSADEVLAAVENADNAVVMLPQPFVTVAQTKVQNLNTVLDLTKEWDALGTGGKLITAGLFVRNDFLESNKELVDEFISNYTDSVKWINENVEEASKLVEANDIIKAPIAAKAIPYCNLVSITGDDMKSATEDYLMTLFNLNPKSVGGALPGEEFYYTGK